MKSFVVAAVVALLAVQANAAGLLPSAGCTVSTDSSGASTVTFTFSPSPSDLLATRSDLKSPLAMINLLNSTSNGAMVAATALKNTLLRPFTTLFGGLLPSAPNCEFFWISGQLICTKISPNNVLVLSACKALGNTTNSPGFKLPVPLPLGSITTVGCEEGGLWGLNKIGAPAANAAGFSGQGVTVCGIDSGVRHTHEELKDSWRSEYGWFNGYDASSTTPFDDNGHGTHTMGSIVGKTVGVAPGAKWIACKACDSTASCANGPLMKCLQWAACPDGGKLNCTTAPKVINNSWGGGMGDVTFNGALKVLASMGITSVFSAGNSGNMCGTVVSPADEPQRPLSLLSIAATDCQDVLGSFSSAGPTMAADIMGELGITVAGPGVTILSSWIDSDTARRNESGTSMSSPYVAGAVAVLLSKNSALTYDQIFAALTKGAYKRTDVNSALSCGGFNMTQTQAYPNNFYGYGRIQLGDSLNLV